MTGAGALQRPAPADEITLLEGDDAEMLLAQVGDGEAVGVPRGGHVQVAQRKYRIPQ